MCVIILWLHGDVRFVLSNTDFIISSNAFLHAIYTESRLSKARLYLFFARSLSGSCITAFEKLMLDGLYMSTVLKMGFLRNRLESFRDSKKEVYLIQVKEIPNYIYRCSLLVTKSDF